MPKETTPQWRAGWEDHHKILEVNLDYAIVHAEGDRKEGLKQARAILQTMKSAPRFTR